MGARPLFPEPGDAVGSDCLGQGPHPNPSPIVQHLQEKLGKDNQGTRRGSESLGGHWGRNHRELKDGNVQTVTKRCRGVFFPLGKPFPKGSTRTMSALQVVWKRHSRVRRAVHVLGGIQVKQEPGQDQERGAWEIPSIYSVLVSPSGVFSVYLFFSREHGGP